MIFLAFVPLVIWVYLAFAHAGFWQTKKHLPARGLPRFDRRVAVVIPARDEAESIGRTVRSLRNQNLPPGLLVVVDDNSSDETRDLARATGAQTVSGKPLPDGWSGKVWALSQGISFAETISPDYLLFTDADIEHDFDSLRQLVSIAETGKYDLVSFMARLRSESFAEQALIPAFVFFFFLLYPPGKVPGAAGGCVLIRPEALRRAGGLQSIRSEVIDDCALAKAVAAGGGRIWLGLTESVRSMRSYGSFGEVANMIARTAFNQLHHSSLLLLGTLLGLFVTFLLPIMLVCSGHLRYALPGAAGWLLMSAVYAPMVRFYGLPVFWSLTLPFAACFYGGATVLSAVRYWRGSGGLWKGRVQDERPIQPRRSRVDR